MFEALANWLEKRQDETPPTYTYQGEDLFEYMSRINTEVLKGEGNSFADNVMFGIETPVPVHEIDLPSTTNDWGFAGSYRKKLRIMSNGDLMAKGTASYRHLPDEKWVSVLPLHEQVGSLDRMDDEEFPSWDGERPINHEQIEEAALVWVERHTSKYDLNKIS